MLKNLVLVLLFLPLLMHAQQPTLNCGHLKESTFYIYPRNSTDQFKVIRTKDRQVEYNLKTGDSIVYNIRWDNDCQYMLSHFSSTTHNPSVPEETRKKTILTYQVNAIASGYYVYHFVGTPTSDKGAYRHETTDTAWFKPVSNPRNEELFKPLTEKPEYVKVNFKDTSSYAIVYMYRTVNASASANEFSVYLDNHFIFRAQNKSKVAYKIVKQGEMTFRAKVGDAEAEMIVDIEYGKKYYLSCVLRNSSGVLVPEMRLEEQYDGESEFRTLQTAAVGK